MPWSYIAYALLCVTLTLGIVEYRSLKRWNQRVSFRCQLDMRLSEPGETVTLRYRICNTGFWPMSSVSLSFLFDKELEILEEGWQETEGKAVRDLFTVNSCLLPHRVLQGKVRLACRERGLYSVGRVYLETGDFLGLRPVVRSFDLPVSLVCTAAPVQDVPRLEPLGGFLGDVSVRRFILEDPSLVLGYREYSGREPIKAISWTQTAKTGRLMVKNHDFTVDVDVAVLVDLEACSKPVAERCLSLVRTVCDELEGLRIPYTVHSNGDLYSTQKGVGKTHNFEIQRRIGLSRFMRLLGFSHILDRSAADAHRRGYIVVVPALTQEIAAGVRRLQAASGTRVCVLTGEEAAANA